MSDTWHDPETLDSHGERKLHTTAYVIALVALLAIGGAIARIATAGPTKHLTSPAAPTPGSAPNFQESPPLATPTPFATAIPSGTPSPGLAAAYQQVMTRARHARSVRSSSTETTSNGLHLQFVDADGTSEGTQHITINGQLALVRVVGRDTYFFGSPAVMAGFFGVTPAAAVRLGNHWVHLTAGERGYSSVTADVTLASTLQEVTLAGPLTRLPPQVRDGIPVYGIQGALAHQDGVKGRGTLWVASRSMLPVEFDLTSARLEATDRFADWGAPVNVAAPAHSVDGRGAFTAPSTGGGGPGVAA